MSMMVMNAVMFSTMIMMMMRRRRRRRRRRMFALTKYETDSESWFCPLDEKL
jgi:hypothetical protein